jgi:hypothetical protein
MKQEEKEKEYFHRESEAFLKTFRLSDVGLRRPIHMIRNRDDDEEEISNFAKQCLREDTSGGVLFIVPRHERIPHDVYCSVDFCTWKWNSLTQYDPFFDRSYYCIIIRDLDRCQKAGELLLKCLRAGRNIYITYTDEDFVEDVREFLTPEVQQLESFLEEKK